MLLITKLGVGAVIVEDWTVDDVPTEFVAEANALNILGAVVSLSCIT